MRRYSAEKDKGLWLAVVAWLGSLNVRIVPQTRSPARPAFYHKDKYSRMFVFDNGMQLLVFASSKYNSDETDPLNWNVSAVQIKGSEDE